MNPEESEDGRARSERRRRRRLVVEVKGGLRALKVELSTLERAVGSRARLRDVDFECLEVLNLHGPLGPTALARRVGVHPATLTSVLDRLERGGWVARERDPDAADRRAVTIRALRERNPELLRLLSGMDSAMDEICAGYSDAELELVAGFLRRVAGAGTRASEELKE